jgi:hypothetical protein
MARLSLGYGSAIARLSLGYGSAMARPWLGYAAIGYRGGDRLRLSVCAIGEGWVSAMAIGLQHGHHARIRERGWLSAVRIFRTTTLKSRRRKVHPIERPIAIAASRAVSRGGSSPADSHSRLPADPIPPADSVSRSPPR